MRIRNITKIIFTALILISNSIVTAQEKKTDSLSINLNKNSINLSYGIFAAHFSYERLYQGKVFGSRNSTIVDFGLGGVSYWEGESPFVISRFGILTGAGSRHLEAKLGIFGIFGPDLKGVLPSVAIGYRKQKPGSHFIFRTGIGFPDLLHVSWGLSF
jgi:hypothetical protein